MCHVICDLWLSLACAVLIEAPCEGITVLCLELAEIISKDYFWDKKSWRGTFDKGIQDKVQMLGKNLVVSVFSKSPFTVLDWITC